MDFFQHFTGILIIIQLKGKGKIMSCFFPVTQESVRFPWPFAWLNRIRVYFSGFVEAWDGRIWLLSFDEDTDSFGVWNSQARV